MNVWISKHTPGLLNGKDVHFEICEVVEYQKRNGERFTITIDSEYMTNSGYYGYEAIFHNDGKRYFAVDEGIINWEGKVK